MKKPLRDVLIEETRSMQPDLDRIRRSVLDQQFGLGQAPQPGSGIWARMCSLLPRWQWAGLAAAWLVMGFVHLSTPSAPPAENTSSAANFMEQREMLGEVLRSMEKPARSARDETRGSGESKARLV